jgi:hypothetical protein
MKPDSGEREVRFACPGGGKDHNAEPYVSRLCRNKSPSVNGYGWGCCLPRGHRGEHRHCCGIAWSVVLREATP